MKVADYMAFLTIKNDKIVAFGDIFQNGLLLIQLAPELVKIGNLEMGAVTDTSCLRANFL